MRTAILCAAFAASGVACDNTVGGVPPVGGDTPSTAEIERFARRLHLDLTASQPSEGFVGDAVAQLGVDGGNTAAARLAIAQALVDDDGFAGVFVSELEDRTFGGESADDRYDLLCGIVRTDDPTCNVCGPPADGDPCGTCGCAPLTYYFDEREALATAADDLASGDSTSSIERRYAASSALRYLSSPDGVAESLFEAFLGHTPQLEERMNAAAMVQGALLPGSPAGLLYHQHGATFEDLLEIVFGSEVYREAAVSGVFVRYLGRQPTPAELGHFAAGLDADDPDVRDVILAVVSSREYFEQ
jgi:hypothetical protein